MAQTCEYHVPRGSITLAGAAADSLSNKNKIIVTSSNHISKRGSDAIKRASEELAKNLQRDVNQVRHEHYLKKTFTNAAGNLIGMGSPALETIFNVGFKDPLLYVDEHNSQKRIANRLRRFENAVGEMIAMRGLDVDTLRDKWDKDPSFIKSEIVDPMFKQWDQLSLMQELPIEGRQIAQGFVLRSTLEILKRTSKGIGNLNAAIDSAKTRGYDNADMIVALGKEVFQNSGLLLKLKSQLDGFLKQNENNSQSISLNSHQIKELKDRINVVEDAIDKLSNTPYTSQFKINTDLSEQDLQDLISLINNEIDITYDTRHNRTESLIFSLLRPEQQAHLLMNSPDYLNHLDKETRERMLKDIKLHIRETKSYEQRRALIKTCQELQQVAQASHQVAMNIGLKGKDAENVGQALEWINAGAQVGVAIAEPTPATVMNALASVTALFSDPQPDPQIEMLMKNFGAIHDSLHRIEEAIQTVHENQALIMKQLLGAENRIIAKLDEINKILKKSYELKKDHAALQIQLIADHVDGYRVFLEGRDIYLNKIPTTKYYNLISGHYRIDDKGRTKLWNAITKLEDLLTAVPVHQYWLHSLWNEESQFADDVTEFEIIIFTPLIKRVLDSCERQGISIGTLVKNVSNPCITPEDLVFRYYNDGQPHFHGYKVDSSISANALQRLIHPRVVIKHSIDLLEMRMYLGATLSDEDKELLTPEMIFESLPGSDDVFRRELRRARTERALTSARKLLDIAITQQVLLSGDYGLISLQHDLEKVLANGDSENKLGEFLDNNSLLTRNLFISSIRSHLKNRNHSFQEYRQGWGPAPNFKPIPMKKRKELMHSLFPAYWVKHLQKNGDVWLITVGDSKLELPKPEEIERGELTIPHIVQDLKAVHWAIDQALHEHRILADSKEFTSTAEDRNAVFLQRILQ